MTFADFILAKNSNGRNSLIIRDSTDRANSLHWTANTLNPLTAGFILKILNS